MNSHLFTTVNKNLYTHKLSAFPLDIYLDHHYQDTASKRILTMKRVSDKIQTPRAQRDDGLIARAQRAQ